MNLTSMGFTLTNNTRSFCSVLTYTALLFICLMVSSFFISWLLLEFMTFTLVYTVSSLMKPSYLKSVLIYFMIQSILSMCLLLIYLYSSTYVSYFVSSMFWPIMLTKLGMFPLFYWYYYSMVWSPVLFMLVVVTFHKLPLLVLVLNWPQPLLMSNYMIFLLLIVSLNSLVSGILMIMSTEITSFLVATSMSSSSWLFLSIMSFWEVSLMYFLLSSVFILSFFFMTQTPHYKVSSSLLLSMLVGVPPSPLFFIEVFIIYSYVMLNWLSLYWVILLGLCISFVMSLLGAFILISKFVVDTYSSIMI